MIESSADDEVARKAIIEYGFSPEVVLKMINLSENATYLVEDADHGYGGVLRVHRKDYHEKQAILSELDWLAALGRESDLNVITPVPTPDGRRVVEVPHDGTTRYAVLLELINGFEPDETQLRSDDFRTLGEVTASLHLHSQEWTPPPGFRRFSWDWQHCLGDKPRWGKWQDGIGIGPAEIAHLQPAVDCMRRKLQDYGSGDDRYGLIHADLRPANLLVDGDVVNVIDFDDCGYGWFLYDWGAAVSFMEDSPELGNWQEGWLTGYQEHRKLSTSDVAMLPTFVMYRRMMLTAWMGSHNHSAEAKTKGASYSAGTCEIAQRYLDSNGLSIV